MCVLDCVAVCVAIGGTRFIYVAEGVFYCMLQYVLQCACDWEHMTHIVAVCVLQCACCSVCVAVCVLQGALQFVIQRVLRLGALDSYMHCVC